jgi:hypothetical protein
MQKWQYMRDEVKSEAMLDERLAHWGSLGWELVTVIQDRGEGKTERGLDFHYRWSLFFKQPSQ